MNREELERLISRYLDGIATPAEAAGLSREIETGEIARQLYWQHARLHAALAAAEQPAASEQDAPRVQRAEPGFLAAWRTHWQSPPWKRALAGLLAVLALAGLLILRRAGLGEAPQPAPAVAVLKRAVAAQWREAGRAPAVGQTLAAGWLRLRSGTVQIEFLGGARMLVVGPAEIRLDAANAAFLATGKASAYVPEAARGFTLRVPEVAIVDLGTAFGVNVCAEAPAEVHVFEGAVNLMRLHATNAPHRLQAGQAAQLAGPAFRDTPIRPGDFPNPEELARRDDAQGRARWEAWQTAMAQLAALPATLLCYTFEGESAWSRSVTNHAWHAAAETHGAIVGAAWTGGRWPGKRALEFRSQGDRLRFTLPGAHPALTLMAWVRVDSLPNDFNSLLMPSRYQAGSIHWIVERDGALRLTLLNNPAAPLHSSGWDGPANGSAISDADYGRWVFLATTYNSATGDVAHYRDGLFIGGGNFRHRLPAILGPVEFGNWGAVSGHPDTAWTKSQRSNQFLRNFIGRIDELVALARVLSPEEIAGLYETGKP